MTLISKITDIKHDLKQKMRIQFAARTPVYIFHHIPKCGGTSVSRMLQNWFLTVRDYRKGWSMEYPEKLDLARFKSCHCICGHFELDGYHLDQRYPEVFNSDRYQVFTFLRDPLQVQLSLFRFEKLQNQSKAKTLEEHLQLRSNYLANRFPATIDNYKTVIDRYNFVGILEEKDKSICLLSKLLGKPYQSLPWLNKSKQSQGVAENVFSEVSEDLEASFREKNKLDYLIYEYSRQKFNVLANEHGL